MKNTICLIFLLCIFFQGIAQPNDSITLAHTPQDSISVKQIALVSSIIPITATGVYIYLNKVWWADQRVAFHITDDLELRYALNLDKAGHFISSYFVSGVFSDVFRFAGMPQKYSVWSGAAMSIINATIVEIKDGFSPYWGFSKFDELANISGALYPVLQYYVPVLQNINFCWSYDFTHPSYYKTLPGHQDKSFIDDYERQNFWITCDVASMCFPNKKQSKFPYFIEPAFGMSAQKLDGKGSGTYEWFIGFQIDFTKFRFTKYKAEPVIYKYLHYYHMPLPALRLHPELTPYILTY